MEAPRSSDAASGAEGESGSGWRIPMGDPPASVGASRGSGGRAAISLARQFRPDLALLDVRMPDIDGYTAAKSIREQKGGADVYLIALTGLGQEDDKRRATEAGFSVHLTKPVDPDQLRDLLAWRIRSAHGMRNNPRSSRTP